MDMPSPALPILKKYCTVVNLFSSRKYADIYQSTPLDIYNRK